MAQTWGWGSAKSDRNITSSSMSANRSLEQVRPGVACYLLPASLSPTLQLKEHMGEQKEKVSK